VHGKGGRGTMGKLVELIHAKKQKIINMLICEKAYQPGDRNDLFNLPLKDLEELQKQLKEQKH
jgi:hypothetical protein